MVQATQSHGNDLAVTSGIRFSITAARRLLRQSEVSAVVVVVEDVLGHQTRTIELELVSKTPPERDPEAGEVKEGVINGE